MTINETREGSRLTVALEGRLDTITAPDLEKRLQKVLPGVKELVFDMEKLEYLSSAGLRVLLYAHKTMTAQGSMVVRHVNDLIVEVFEVTGFSSILNIE